MLNLALGGHSEADVINQLHYRNGGREIKYKVNVLNKHENKIGEISTTPSGNTINFDSLAEIKRTANFRFKEGEFKDLDWLNDKIQPVFMLRMPNDAFVEWNLGVFLLYSPTRKEDYLNVWRDVEAYDSSVILKEDKFDNRYIISANTLYTDAINTILNSANINKINITHSAAVINVDKEFEIGTTKLEAINSLLMEINYTSVWVDENGYFTSVPYILPTQREVEYSYKTDFLSVFGNGVQETLDVFNVPNKWIVTASNAEKIPITSKYTNDLPTSITSTINRNRTITKFVTINDISDQDTLDAYVKRLAYNDSQIYGSFMFSTCCMPHHTFSDIIYVEHSTLNIKEKFTETSWSMELQAGGKMSHNLRRVIKI
ncbi:hypothetical protein LY28_01352 [Ruminiclostridium sufflavum DSM 19573]|uniref:Uncharacterized protein n=1 Tax=Ruminiclostridium sufflavum DSM 19573 TaxID=1121337 RepID=A0A318XLJ8_9FIRM|nr:hypothetical protein [Ruminiclostridium sufflavum]PYG88503.1 hypothetical protein LY28_01352 [Ruminiclostridium sufflavum DSM 19573]